MTKNKNFAELGLIDPICANLEKLGITEPTPVQRDSIPLVLADRDIICESATGSGKTIAFGAGLIDKLEENRHEKVLILTPTRELAEQVSDALKTVARGMKVRTCVIYGGVGYAQQISNYERSDIIVATPGRLLDHVKQNNIDLTPITRIVLDEADRMLDMGFLPDVKLVLRHLPNKKQFLCFSATYSHEIASTTKSLLNDPARVVGEKAVDPRKLEQIYYDIHGRDKFSLLVHLLQNETSASEMIFTNSRKMADVLETNLRKFNIRASALHGGFTQAKRQKVLKDFQSKKLTCLIATDVAARGLDIPHVSHVYNYDLPPDSKQYIHRIGRTARAGKEGIAISLVSQRDHEDFDKIIRFERVPIEHEPTPDFEKLKVEFDFGRGRDQGRGGSRDGGRGRGMQRGGPNRGSPRGSSRPMGNPRHANRDRRDGDRPRGMNHGGSRAPREGGNRGGYSRDGARSGSREDRGERREGGSRFGGNREGGRGGYSRDGARSGSREDRGGNRGGYSRDGARSGSREDRESRGASRFGGNREGGRDSRGRDRRSRRD